MKQKTPILNVKEALSQREWYVVDAKDQVLGRLAVKIAMKLMGKDKPTYTPHVDCGDFVIVLNANKFRITGNKLATKTYYHHTHYPEGLRARKLTTLLKTKPTEPLMEAVRRMLPKNHLGTGMLRKLKLFAGTEHPHEAQNPKTWNTNN
jgi:large subunit ribosomal protein L13